MRITSAEFIKSAETTDHYTPETLPEVAFAGRSNSGKSTLINTLAGYRRLAKASTSPGRTRLIQFFVINGTISFADLPGYGYAKVPQSLRVSWRSMVETYFRERGNLRLVILVADIRRDISDDERMLIDWLGLYGRPVILVLSKIDKLSRNQRNVRLKHIRQSLDALPAENLFLCSARTGEGKEKIWLRIEDALKSQTGISQGPLTMSGLPE
ncbi:MAG: YihA family ribosome biogenesis GTP-binding protein [Deltaproteobacteria bacterium]|jgi:GTP-binding protein|nr:YihA family ribosome biogenesis GTP-binding protein [Deltaproteobacteria bacterium]